MDPVGTTKRSVADSSASVSPRASRQPVARFLVWVFDPHPSRVPWWKVLGWWELRRVPFNIVVGAWGIACLAVYFVAIWASGELKPGEDAVEPIALLAVPLVLNVAYSLGFAAELSLRRWAPTIGYRPRLGVSLLKLGLALSITIVALPAATVGMLVVGGWIMRLVLGPGPY